MIKSSPHFSEQELSCRCCGTMPKDGMSVFLLDGLEWLRSKVGPIHVTCAYRCPEHNAKVGGVDNSQHVLGTAADIWCEALSTHELAEVARQRFDGVGEYHEDAFVHVDMRDDGKMAGYYTWSDSDDEEEDV